MSNIPRWNDVRADFGDTGRMFSAAQQGLSNAGTVFGQLRASILAEEQKGIDNAFREKQLSENIRQFGLTNALEQDKFGEAKRRNLILEEDTDLDREQRAKEAMLQHNASMAGIGVQRDRLNMDKTIQDIALQDREVRKQVYNQILGTRQEALAAEEAAQANSTGPISPEQQTQNETKLKQLRDQLSATALDNDVRVEIGKRLGVVDAQTPVTGLATTEQARANAAITRNAEAAKALDQSQIKANEIQSKLNLGTEDSAALQRAMSMVQQQYPTLKPETAMSILSSYYPTTGEITSSRQKFDVPIGETDYLVNFNPTDRNNPLAVRLAQAAGKGENLLSGSGDTTKIPDSTPKEQPISLGNLTDEALAYQREKILASQPSEPSSEQIQTRFNQLVRSSWGDMPTDKIPPNALKTLEERALQDARTAIQKERTQATSRIDDEIRTRQRNEAMYNSMMYMR